jgi:hypothetical protein
MHYKRPSLNQYVLEAGAVVREAAGKGFVPEIEEALNSGKPDSWVHSIVNTRDESGETALFKAVRQGRYEATFVLLENGADVNHQEYGELKTPLDVAIEAGHEKIVRLLVHYGARRKIG